MRRTFTILTSMIVVMLTAAPALACGGLIGPNGGVNLLRTSTLAAYHDGVEHYITSFEFAGGGAEFGSIIPLPAMPTDVIKGGDWTLQRLRDETQPVLEEFVLADTDAGVARSAAKVVMERRIDSLDVTILEGGGDSVGQWAIENGFNLSPDTPEVLDFYARRSPYFLAARFDPQAARDQGFTVGDGTPVHVVMPTPRPWVPLRILGLGKQAGELVQADVYLLTDRRPALLPQAGDGMFLDYDQAASDLLLADLRSDRGMKWLPDSGMWLSYLRIDAEAGKLDHDLAIDASGFGMPSPVDAGFELPTVTLPDTSSASTVWAWALAAIVAGGAIYLIDRRATTWR